MKIILKRKEEVPEETLIRVVDFIRTFRVLQISKLIKHFPGFQLLVSTSTSNTTAPPSIFSPQMETMRASAQELIIWVYCFAMFVVIFGSTVYYAERCSVLAQLPADSIRVQADGESPQPVHLHPQLHVVGGRHHVYRGYGEYRNEFYLPCAEVWI